MSYNTSGESRFTSRFWTGIITAVVLLVLGTIAAFECFEVLPANQVMVIQYPNGTMVAHTTPGIKWQGFGSIQKFDRSFQHWFYDDAEKKTDGANSKDDSIKIRFNDGGNAQISGSVRVDLPTDPEHILALYTTYHTQDAIQKALVDTVIEKSVYMTGPLMTSKESYADRRNELIALIEDQALHGVYQTTSKEAQVEDPIATAANQASAAAAALKAGTPLPEPILVKKWVRVTDIKTDPKTGTVLRQEVSPLERFGITLSNLSINSVKYDPTVEKQIAAQQEATMQVQTAIAESRKAEQDKITTEAKGAADAAKAKWTQEALKAKAVTEAEQLAEVAKIQAEQEKSVKVTAAQALKESAEFEKQTAELLKEAAIAKGEGQAKAAHLVMEANGALELKLQTYEKVMGKWAESFASYRGALVPSVVMTNSGAPGAQAANNGVGNLIDLLTVKTASDLGLDMAMRATVSQPDLSLPRHNLGGTPASPGATTATPKP